jgi:hypothetical protein
MSKKLVEYLLLIALLLLAGGAVLAQTPPAEARLDKYPAELKLGNGEARCGDYIIFHDGAVNFSGTDKISYFYVDGTPKYAMPALNKVEVVVADKSAPTVQQFTEDGTVKKVILAISQADLDKATCLKKKAEKPK